MLKGHKYLATLSLAAILIGLGFSPAAAASITACGTFGAGSYTVVNNISSAGINCLIFDAGPVTLDLGGFTVSGSGATNGVLAISIANVTLRNGSIKGFARSAYLNGAGALVDGVRALTGSANGITVGDNSTVQNCLVNGHTAGGISAGKNATIVGNTLSGNIGNMIVVSDGSTVKSNTVTQNTGNSASAIQITQNCRVVDNVVGTSAFGVNATGNFNLISGNTIRGSVEGITAAANEVITGNNSSGNSDNGIEAGTDCLISGNNTSGNALGITADIRTLFLNNVANSNSNFGIHVNANSSAIGNVADNNSSSGLEVACPSKVLANTAIGNGTPNLNEKGAGCLNTDNLTP